jgi:hypothetical protein
MLCALAVYNGKPAPSHLKWVKHSKHVDFVFEGPTSLAGSVLTQTGVWFNYATPAVTGSFFMRSAPARTTEQLEVEYAKPFDVFLCASAADVGDFARGLVIDLERHGYRAFLERVDSPVDRKRDHAILKNSKNVVIVLSDNLFADEECAKEIEAAIASERRILLLTYAGSSWSDQSFPPEQLIPESLRPAFASKESMTHVQNAFDDLTARLREKLGDGSGTKWT